MEDSNYQTASVILMSLRRGDFQDQNLSDGLAILSKVVNTGQLTTKNTVNKVTEILLVIAGSSDKAQGPRIEVLLEVWKRYLPFLKQFHSIMDPEYCQKFISILQAAIISTMGGIKEQLVSKSGNVTVQTFGMMNFLCQRLSASISFFVSSAKISHRYAVVGLNAIASAYAFLLEHPQAHELLIKYQNFFNKAIRCPSIDGGASQAGPFGTGTSSLRSASSQFTADERQTQEDNGFFLSLLSAIVASLEGAFDVCSGEEAIVHQDSSYCYGLASLTIVELHTTSKQSTSSETLGLSGSASLALFHVLVSAIATICLRFHGDYKDDQVHKLLKGGMDCYASIRNLYTRHQDPTETHALDALVLSLCLLPGQSNSYGSTRSEIGRWMLCGYLKGASDVAQSEVSLALQAVLTAAATDLSKRPQELEAAALTVRAVLSVLGDNQAKSLLLFLKQFDDSPSGGRVKVALWAKVPFLALRNRSKAVNSVISGILTSTCREVVDTVALYSTSSEPLDHENREKLGQALAVLSGCGRSSSAAAGSESVNVEPLIDLVSVNTHREAVQFVIKAVGYYTRYLDKVFVQSLTGAAGAGLHMNPNKVTSSLKVTLSLLQVLLHQKLPPKIISKLLMAGQVSASLAMRAAGLCKEASDRTLPLLSRCILMAANVSFVTISICCYPVFHEAELENVKSLYHSLVKASEALSTEENKRTADFMVEGGGSAYCCGWRLWCLLQKSLGECVASFPLHLKPQARHLIPQLYLPLMIARQHGKTGTIDETGQCKHNDVYAYLYGQHQQNLRILSQSAESGDEENRIGQNNASVLHIASDFSWKVAKRRGLGINSVINTLSEKKEPLKSVFLVYEGEKRAKTA